MGCCESRPNGVTTTGVANSVLNVGGFAETYRTGTAMPFELRTMQSSDGTVSIVQNANDIDFTVPSSGPGSNVFQIDSTATRTSNTTTLTTMDTIPGTSKMLAGEEWKLNFDVGVAVPVGIAGNAEQVWQIETSAGVFTEIDRFSIHEPLIISGAEQAWPQCREKNIIAAMDSPRMRLQVHRTSAGAESIYWELPTWGGFQIAEAP